MKRIKAKKKTGQTKEDEKLPPLDIREAVRSLNEFLGEPHCHSHHGRACRNHGY